MYTVDPTFSVYSLIERIQQERIVLNHRRTMSLISYEIENAALIDGVHIRIFAGFQYLSKFLPQVKRYKQLAATAEAVYVFGVPDIQPPPIPNVRYINLTSSDRLAKEWFLIAHSIDFSSALATEEISQFSDPDDQRQFKGVWTFEVEIVTIMNDWLTSLVDARPLADAEGRHNYERQQQLVGKSVARLSQMAESLKPTATIASEVADSIRNSGAEPAE